MGGPFTFSIVKPNAVKSKYTGAILSMIEKAGFEIVAIKKTKLSKQQAEMFYAVHAGKEFFPRLIDFMTSGPVVALMLKKENAVVDFRKLLGSTNPDEAQDGTIRKLYAKDMTQNAAHGSDSDENAEIESNFFFSKLERFSQYEN